MRWRRIVLLGVLYLLVACGGQSSSLTPDQLHRSWIEAMQSNDREHTKRLMAPELLPYLDSGLHDVQTTLHSEVLGPLSGTVDVLAPVVEGKGQVGLSRWPFAHKTVCYQTTIAETPDGWKVTGFGQIACPHS